MSFQKKNLNSNEIQEALKLANAYDFIMQFPKKLETMVGEKAQKFREAKDKGLLLQEQ